MELLDTLKKYERQGWLRSQRHDTLPLSIWNYTEQTQYERKWNEITLLARGLVIDDLGNIQAHPLKKFFNLEEGGHIPTDNFEIFDKVDGSLIILFCYEGNWIFATRGSFNSDQAIKAREIAVRYPLEDLPMTYTFLFEVLYKENHIVVDYGNTEDLILLTAINTKTGNELSYNSIIESMGKDFNIIKRYNGLDYTKVKQLNTPNSEGFVVKFTNGHRCKIKFEDYVRLHRIMTNLSTTSIWDIVRRGTKHNLDRVPDEFYTKIKDYENHLLSRHAGIELKARQIYNSIAHIQNRRKFAEQALTCPAFSSIILAMRDGKEYSDMIWKKLKPEYAKL